MRKPAPRNARKPKPTHVWGYPNGRRKLDMIMRVYKKRKDETK